jgi:hypothetical protein
VRVVNGTTFVFDEVQSRIYRMMEGVSFMMPSTLDAFYASFIGSCDILPSIRGIVASGESTTAVGTQRKIR